MSMRGLNRHPKKNMNFMPFCQLYVIENIKTMKEFYQNLLCVKPKEEYDL